VYCHQFKVQIFNLLAVSTKGTAFAVYIELGPFRSKLARHVKGTCDFLEYSVVSENRIGHEVVLIRLELALVLIVIHIP
jgi:nucleoid-associated protein YejK